MKIARSLLKRAALALSALLAATATAQTGIVIGRVTDDAVGLALGGALVRVSGASQRAFTNDQGEYVLSNVPAGEHTLEVAYLGYEPLRQSASVSSGATTRVDFSFLDQRVTELEGLVIEGELVGTARALNRQRAAESLTNIVASDEIGNFPDQNAAESLQRIPGIALYRDQGEGRYVVLRGLNYTFTSVELDGVAFAGADLGERATALDVVSSDLLSAIEVTKAPTPDMDAEGIAGKVNLKTKSPFDSDANSASARTQITYSDINGELGYKFSGETSWISQDGRWGFLVAPSWQDRKFASYNYETGGAWSEEESPTDGEDYYFNEEIEFREYDIDRERYGLTATVEHRPNDTSKLYLRGNYNKFTDTEKRWQTIIPFADGEIVELDGGSAVVEDVPEISRRLRQREKDQEVLGLIAGLESVQGAWTYDGYIGLSQGKEKRPDETSVNFRRSEDDGVFRYDFSNPYDYTVAQLDGASLFDPASYDELNAVEIANESGEENSVDMAMNIRYDLAVENPAYLKFGMRYRTKEKTSEAEVFEYEDGPDSFSFANVAGPTGDYPFLRVPQIDADALNDAFAAGFDQFEQARLMEDSILNDWTSDEEIIAFYAMGNLRFGRSTVIAGARFEHTKFTTDGFELDEEEEEYLPGSAEKDYDDVLPGVHYRYDFSDRLVFRASWTNSIARPDFDYTPFRKLINHEDEEIEVGNPDLDTLESTNWDASIEYYLPSLGVLSAAVFHKDIENFSYEIDIEDGDPAYPGYEVTTYMNGSEGSIQGLELAYQQQLVGLSEALRGFGLMANVTFLQSEAEYPTRPDEDLPFIGQSDLVGNLALTYEIGGFFVRAALNHRTERLREDEAFGDDIYEDLWVDDFTQLDVTLRYQFSEQWTIYSELVNLTNEPFRVFLRSPDGAPDRLGQFEEYGWSGNFGVRWNY